MCLCGGICTCVHMCADAPEAVDSSRDGVTGDCGPSYIGAGNRTFRCPLEEQVFSDIKTSDYFFITGRHINPYLSNLSTRAPGLWCFSWGVWENLGSLQDGMLGEGLWEHERMPHVLLAGAGRLWRCLFTVPNWTTCFRQNQESILCISISYPLTDLIEVPW